MKSRLLILFALALLFVSFNGQAQTWERLGSRVVNYSIEKDDIFVGAHEGAFTKLKIEVRGGAINMHKMVVHYMNGTQQEIELKHNFTKSSSSRVIDLTGNKRLIKKITFVYDTKNLARAKARIHVFGRH